MNLEEAVQDLRQRLSLVESQLQQLFEHLNIAPGEGAEGAELDPNDDPEIQDLLAKGNEAQAIKRYLEVTGVGLDEAKQAIERAQEAG
jgi:ribosomal protein L7/L12